MALGSPGPVVRRTDRSPGAGGGGCHRRHDRLPQSLHAYFIKGGRVGVDVVYIVEPTRDGRSFDTRRVTACQDGVPIFEMLASFHVPETDRGLAATRHAATAAGRGHHRGQLRRSAGPTTSRPGWPPVQSTDWPQQPFWFRSRERDRGRSAAAGLRVDLRLRSGHGLHRPAAGHERARPGRCCQPGPRAVAAPARRPAISGIATTRSASATATPAVWPSVRFTTATADWWPAWPRSRSGVPEAVADLRVGGT